MLRQKVLGAFVWNLAIVAVGLINGILLARWLGPAVRGEVAAAMLWPTLLIYLSSFGLFPAVTYFAAQADAHPGRASGTAFGLASFFGMGGLIVGYVIMPFVLASQAPQVVTAARTYLAIVPLSLIGLSGTNVLLGMMRVHSVNLLRAIVPCGYLLGTIALGISHQLTLMHLILLHVGLNTLFVGCTVGVLAGRGLLRGFGFDSQLAPSVLRYGTKIHVGTLGSLINQNLAQAAMARFCDSAQLGLYVTATNAAGVIQSLAQAVQLVTLPRVAGDNSDESRRDILERIFRHFWTASLLIAPVFGIALPFLIVLLFGHKFADSIVPAEILVLGFVFSGSRDLLVVGAQGSGKPLLGSAIYWLGAAVTTALLYLLLPHWGIVGAAIATATANLVQLVVTLVGLHRSTGMSARRALRLDIRETFRLVWELVASLRPGPGLPDRAQAQSQVVASDLPDQIVCP